jgi:hypothetical protein
MDGLVGDYRSIKALLLAVRIYVALTSRRTGSGSPVITTVQLPSDGRTLSNAERDRIANRLAPAEAPDRRVARPPCRLACLPK